MPGISAFNQAQPSAQFSGRTTKDAHKSDPLDFIANLGLSSTEIGQYAAIAGDKADLTPKGAKEIVRGIKKENLH